MYQKSVNTLSLTSNAYQNIIFSYKNSNSSIHYSDNLLFKIFDNKTKSNQDINCIIRGFIGDNQVENLNKKATNLFNALEEVQQISKKNYDILKEINELNTGTRLDYILYRL